MAEGSGVGWGRCCGVNQVEDLFEFKIVRQGMELLGQVCVGGWKRLEQVHDLLVVTPLGGLAQTVEPVGGHGAQVFCKSGGQGRSGGDRGGDQRRIEKLEIEMFPQFGAQRFGLKRFAHKVIATGHEGQGAIALRGLGREGNNRNFAAVLCYPNLARCFIAVDLRYA